MYSFLNDRKQILDSVHESYTGDIESLGINVGYTFNNILKYSIRYNGSIKHKQYKDLKRVFND